MVLKALKIAWTLPRADDPRGVEQLVMSGIVAF